MCRRLALKVAAWGAPTRAPGSSRWGHRRHAASATMRLAGWSSSQVTVASLGTRGSWRLADERTTWVEGAAPAHARPSVWLGIRRRRTAGRWRSGSLSTWLSSTRPDCECLVAWIGDIGALLMLSWGGEAVYSTEEAGRANPPGRGRMPPGELCAGLGPVFLSLLDDHSARASPGGEPKHQVMVSEEAMRPTMTIDSPAARSRPPRASPDQALFERARLCANVAGQQLAGGRDVGRAQLGEERLDSCGPGATRKKARKQTRGRRGGSCGQSGQRRRRRRSS